MQYGQFKPQSTVWKDYCTSSYSYVCWLLLNELHFYCIDLVILTQPST